MPDTYVCPNCAATTERPYSVRMIVRTCEECDEHGNWINESLVALQDHVPEPERPDDWESMGTDERLRYALKEGYLGLEDLQV